MRSGFVSIIGRPNVGKSTLLNTLISEHIAIVSSKPGTTRNIIQGIYNDEESQIVFVDTPGIAKPNNKLERVLNKQANQMIRDIDVILFMVDAYSGLGKGDRIIMQSLKTCDSPVILVINKIDAITNNDLILRINDYKDLFPFAEIVPVSALVKDNTDHLIEVVKKYLTNDVRYFETGIKTSNNKFFMISEFVREKLFEVTEKEIPYRLTCLVSHFEEDNNMARIVVDIIVDKDSLKKIIIGKKGLRLKEVGMLARVDIEHLLGKGVYLELYVRTIKNWQNKEKNLDELGFKENA